MGIIAPIVLNVVTLYFLISSQNLLAEKFLARTTLAPICIAVVDVTKNKASVCLIPHTMKVTNFQSKKIGDKINIETDILGKYILK